MGTFTDKFENTENLIKKILQEKKEKPSLIRKFEISKAEKDLSTLSALYASGCHQGMRSLGR